MSDVFLLQKHAEVISGMMGKAILPTYNYSEPWREWKRGEEVSAESVWSYL